METLLSRAGSMGGPSSRSGRGKWNLRAKPWTTPVRFLLRSNLIAFVLDLLFNAGLAVFCLYLFRINPADRETALLQLLWLYLIRTVVFFVYRTHLMLPMARWLAVRDRADEGTTIRALRAAYETPLFTNVFYSFTFWAMYALFTYRLWSLPDIALSSEAVWAGAFLSVAVGLGAFALGFPLNLVVNSRVAGPLSHVARENDWRVDPVIVPLRYRILAVAFCLTATPCFTLLSLQAMAHHDLSMQRLAPTGSATLEMAEMSLRAVPIICVLLSLWAVIAALLLSLTISRTVEQVKGIVDQVFGGTPPQRIERAPVTYPDELGALASGNNRMLDQLQLSQLRIEQQMAELKKANDELREATKVKGEFLASMSHELRTPLNAIIGFSKILARKAQDKLPERQYRNIQLINKSGHHLLALVNDILDFEKIEAGRMAIVPTEVDLEEFRLRLLETFGPRAEEAGVGLEIEVREPPLVLWVDGDRLQQIVGNFIVNAIKYAPEGIIRVVFAREEGQIRLSVSDQGPGISSEEQERIFAPFKQLGNGQAGVGLGLAIVSRLANLLGGKVEVESRLGEGSTFSFLLPGSHELGERGLGRLKPMGEGPELLVVDDQPDYLEMMHGELTDAGYRVHLARSGEMALEMLKTLRPEAVLLDIVMPGIGGWETLKQMRANPDTAQLPVVVTSVLDDAPLGYDLGIRSWLTKPVSTEEFRRVMGRLNPAGRVLLVDDDEATREMLGQVLDDMDVRHQAAASGEQALDALASTPEIEAVILDLGLPDIDGFEVLERLRALPRGESISVVAYTGRDLTAPETERLEKSLARVVRKNASNSVAKVVRAVTGGQASRN